jgi:HD-like signal output (HDOD) protein
MSKSKPIDAILESIDRLPPFPETARKVLELSRDEEVDYKEIVDVIKYDEAITSNCLKVCNSSYYGLRVKTFTVDQAGHLRINLSMGRWHGVVHPFDIDGSQG